MSLQTIYANKTFGITDLKRGDTSFIDELDEPIAVLKRDSVKAYLIPEKLMAMIASYLSDIKLAKMAKKRIANEWEQAEEVNINDL